jgi:hypothetical protein
MAKDPLPLDFGSNKPFYVYLYRDPRRGKKRRPIYVGKGTVARRRRGDAHWRTGATNEGLAAALNEIRAAGREPEIEVVAWFDDESAALALERALIAKIGRREIDTGPLFNLSPGGEHRGTPGQVEQLAFEAAEKLGKPFTAEVACYVYNVALAEDLTLAQLGNRLRLFSLPGEN